MTGRHCLLLLRLGALVFPLAPLVSGGDELRGLWVDAWHDGIKTPAQTAQLVADARAGNFNALFVQVRKRGDAYYESTLEPKAWDVLPQSYDPLADLIAQAHAGPESLQVHAWIVTYNIWGLESVPPGQPAHPFNLHPDWLTRNESGQQWDGSNYQFDPALPEVQQHTFDVAMELVTNYDVDGLHFDYIRYSEHGSPYTHNVWGYHPGAVARFNKLHGRSGTPVADDAEWQQFRRDQVTALVRKTWLSVRALRPEVCVSASCIAWGLAPVDASAAAFESSAAYRQVLQDWRGWLEEGIVDLAVPMVYQNYAAAPGPQLFDEWGLRAREYQAGRAAAVGIGFWLNSVPHNLTQIRLTRDPAPGSGLTVAGNVGFSYASTGNDGVSRQIFFDALTDPATAEIYTPGEAPLFAAPAAVPVQPWKTDESVGHMAGYVLNGLDGVFLDGAVVTISGPELRVLTSDATGFFGAVSLSPGVYILSASQAGLVARERSVTIVGGDVAIPEVVLGPPAFAVGEVERTEDSTRVILWWPSSPGHSYGIESSPDAESWLPLASGIPGDSDFVNHFEDNLPLGTGVRFYRLTELAP